MSRVGKKPIILPAGVTVQIAGSHVSVKGQQGELAVRLPPATVAALVNIAGGQAIALSLAPGRGVADSAQWGTSRALVAKAVRGVSLGFVKQLELNGVGFRVNLSGKKLVLSLGFSHDVEFLLPEGVTAKLDKNIITLSSIDAQILGETAARLRRLRPPEPYKGKGIKYVGEVVRRKAGKAAAKAVA